MLNSLFISGRDGMRGGLSEKGRVCWRELRVGQIIGKWIWRSLGSSRSVCVWCIFGLIGNGGG